jgi:LPPG:FO 2-phospho-L-lactate transferase
VNVGDDDEIYGAHVAADLDTVAYTLAGIEGPEGWGRRGDTWHVLTALEALGIDTTFRLGDADLAWCLARTAALRAGRPLSEITAELTAAIGVDVTVLPASDDRVRTRICTHDGTWLSFQEYFVARRHADRIAVLEFAGAADASPGRGVVDALREADVIVIAPSNPVLSIWPILAIESVRAAVAAARRVVAISPLFGGNAVKGPTTSVMEDVGLPGGSLGIAQAYEGLITDLVVDRADAADLPALTAGGLGSVALDTRMTTAEEGARFAAAFLEWMLSTGSETP